MCVSGSNQPAPALPVTPQYSNHVYSPNKKPIVIKISKGKLCPPSAADVVSLPKPTSKLVVTPKPVLPATVDTTQSLLKSVAPTAGERVHLPPSTTLTTAGGGGTSIPVPITLVCRAAGKLVMTPANIVGIDGSSPTPVNGSGNYASVGTTMPTKTIALPSCPEAMPPTKKLVPYEENNSDSDCSDAAADAGEVSITAADASSFVDRCTGLETIQFHTSTKSPVDFEICRSTDLAPPRSKLTRSLSDTNLTAGALFSDGAKTATVHRRSSFDRDWLKMMTVENHLNPASSPVADTCNGWKDVGVKHYINYPDADADFYIVEESVDSALELSNIDQQIDELSLLNDSKDIDTGVSNGTKAHEPVVGDICKPDIVDKVAERTTASTPNGGKRSRSPALKSTQRDVGPDPVQFLKKLKKRKSEEVKFVWVEKTFENLTTGMSSHI